MEEEPVRLRTWVASRGYEEFLAALADPRHAEHDDFLAWVGYKFDPAECNLAAANAALQGLR
jgi:Plasmid pRiA4b ORF-3-like protein